MCNQSAFGGMLQDLVALNSIVLRPEPLDLRIERRCKQAWEQTPFQSVAKPPSNPGTTVPEFGVPTAATPSPTRGTRPFTAAHSLLANSLSRSSSTPIHFSAFIRSLSSSTPSTTPSTRRFGREKPPSSAASPSSGNASNTPSVDQPRSTKRVTNAQATRDKCRRGTVSPAAALANAVDHGGRVRPAIP